MQLPPVTLWAVIDTHSHAHYLINQVQQAIRGILEAESAFKQDAIAAWEGDKRVVSKWAI